MKFYLAIAFSFIMLYSNAQWEKGDIPKDNPFSDNKPFYFNLATKSCGIGFLNIDLSNYDGRATISIGYVTSDHVITSPFTTAKYEEHIVDLAVKVGTEWKKYIIVLPPHADNQEPTFYVDNNLMSALKNGSLLVIKLEGTRNYLEDCNGMATFKLNGFSTACRNLGL